MKTLADVTLELSSSKLFDHVRRLTQNHVLVHCLIQYVYTAR